MTEVSHRCRCAAWCVGPPTFGAIIKQPVSGIYQPVTEGATRGGAPGKVTGEGTSGVKDSVLALAGQTAPAAGAG